MSSLPSQSTSLYSNRIVQLFQRKKAKAIKGISGTATQPINMLELNESEYGEMEDN